MLTHDFVRQFFFPCARPRWDVQDLLKRIPGLEALRQSVVITDVNGVVTYWNEPASALLGWSAEEAVGARLSDLLMLDVAPDELLQRLHADPEWSGEMALRKRQGTAFLARVYQLVVADDLGAIGGVVRVISDITDATWARRREIENGERAVRALAAAAVGSWQMDVSTGLTTWDQTMEGLFGLEAGTFPGSRDSWRELLHPDERDWAIEEVRRAILAADTIDMEYRVIRPDGREVWLNVLGGLAPDRAPGSSIVAGVAFDITERRRAEEERAAFLASERARRDRFTLLAEASEAFAASLDDDDVIAAVGALAVRRLADWFALDLVEPTGIRTVATAHNDPSKRERVEALGRTFGGGTGILPDVRAVVQDGAARLLERVDVEHWPDVATDEEHRAALTAIGLRSVMIVPLTARGRTFGAMTFVIGETDLSYSNDDLDLAEDLGRRAALSLDNARLYADRTHVARVLQRSLLPPQLPEVPGITLAARYRPAVSGIEIGGDFYDVFQTASNRWSIVLGDVSGKGTDAAVLTGLARHTLRAAAMRADGPEDVLLALNRAVLAPEYGERFVTLAYVQMAMADGAAELLVSSAGHPDPLILRSNGDIENTGEVGSILGLFEDVDVRSELVRLNAGDQLLLYTDGVLEARSPDGEFFGEQRLRDLLAATSGATPDALADRLEATVLDFQAGLPRDDIAILIAGFDPS